MNSTTGSWTPQMLAAWLLAGILGLMPVRASEDAFITAELSSPRTTLNSFREAWRELHEEILAQVEGRKTNAQRIAILEERILSCLDLSKEPEFLRRERGRRAAVCLIEILSRIPLPPDREIPGDEEVSTSDGTPAVTDWSIPRTKVTISMVDEGERKGDFLFSARTVASAPGYFAQIRKLKYQTGEPTQFYEWFQSNPGPWLAGFVGHLPVWMRTTFWGEHAVWQWLGFGLVMVLFPILATAIYMAGRRIAKREKRLNRLIYFLSLVFPIAAMFVPLLAGSIVKEQLHMTGGVLVFTSFSTNVVFLLALMVVITGTGARIGELFAGTSSLDSKGLDAQLIRIVFRVLSIGVASLVFIEGGQYLGIPLSTLLASAGVGGFALALAAQDSLKNFFGSMMIILDRPFRVGERIVIGKFDGIVEEIGLRSTRLRLLTGHQATIPNEEMARSHIENIGRRPHIRRMSILRLPLETTVEKSKEAVAIVEQVLENHEGMREDLPPKVYLTEIEADCLSLCMVYWYHPPEYWDYLAFCQKVNLEVKRRFEEAGIAFAPPTSTTRLVSEATSGEDRLPAAKDTPG